MTTPSPAAPAATPEIRHVLVALFFWRSLELEGGSGLVRATVQALRERGCEVSLLLPDRPAWVPREMEVTPYVGRTPRATVGRYRRELSRRMNACDATFLIENNALSHLWLCRGMRPPAQSAVHLSSPTVGAEILRLGPRRQYFAHWLGKNRRLAGALARLGGFRFPHYLVSTAYQRDELTALGCDPRRVVVKAMGVDSERFVPGGRREPRAGRLVVSYLGHFAPIKGVPDLIAAFERAARGRPGMELRLAWSGKGAESREVREAIAASPVAERIRLEGRVDVARFLSGSDVVVLPFRSASIPHLPLVLLEAFAMGVPVVTTRVGGLAEAVVDGETGFTVPPGDPFALATALETLHDRPELVVRLGEGALALSRARFDSRDFFRTVMAELATPSAA